MPKISVESKEAASNPTMDAIYDPKTYEGCEVTGDWRQGFSLVLNGIPFKFSRSLGVDTQIDFEVWAEVMDESTAKNVLIVKTPYDKRASKLMQDFSQRSFAAISGRHDENRAKAIAAVMWAAGGGKGDKP